MIALLDHWQTLLGAIIGAASAFLLWIIAEFYKSLSNRKDRLQFMGKVVGMEALMAADAHKAISDFLGTRFASLLDQANNYVESDLYFVGATFFPILSFRPLDSSMLNLHTGSGYTDIKFLGIVKRTRDIADAIADLKLQFEATVNGNRELALLKKNPARVQNKQFRDDLEKYRDTLQEQILEKNMSVYIKEIAEAQVCLRELQEKPLWWWKLKYGASFRCFRTKLDLNTYLADTNTRIDFALDKKFQERFNLLNSEFDGKLKYSNNESK